MANPQGKTAFASKASGLIGPSSLLTLAVPIVALILALLTGSALLLNYVHVLTGGPGLE